jgi:hypothetical protein
MTNEPNTAEESGMSKAEIIAASTSAAIIVVGVIFWIIQIKGVMEMLEMAYG